ncbi:MAG: adenylate kinase [Spirosomaceae bacterium]|nr:adenylate kinase [Spirosomataceae bacterium]
MFNIVIFGPPGAGKGTQSEKIIQNYELAHISTGDMFRMHISQDTAIGKKVKQILADGLLVPDSITIDMLEEKVQSNPHAKGFIFDGFPRTVAQAEALDAFLQKKGEQIDLVLQLDVTEDVIKARIEERQKISGRADDKADKLIRRISEYFQKTIHVLPYYEEQNKVVKVNGIGEIEKIYHKIAEAIDNKLVKKGI